MLFFDIFKNEKMDKFLLKISEEKEKENIIVLSQSPEIIGKFPHPCQETIIIILFCYLWSECNYCFSFSISFLKFMKKWQNFIRIAVVCLIIAILLSGVNKGGYWGYLPPPRILGVNTPP